jgi:Xaa-Pro aminopeptidase
MRILWRLGTAAAVGVTLVGGLGAQIAPFEGRDAYATDLAERRAKTLEALGPEAVLVMWSAPERVYSNDVNYEYRQESNLLYLTGIDQDDTTLVLIPGATGAKELLFIREADVRRELWSGRLLTPAEARDRSGIARIYTQRGTEAFDAFMSQLLGGSPAPEGMAADAAEYETVRALVREGRARLGILDRLGAQPPASDAAAHVAWLNTMTSRHPGVTAFSAGDILRRQRQIKTAYEQRLLARSVELSAEAHVEGMKATRPGRWEYEVEAAIEHWYLKNGMMSPGYPSIVASGPNATTLHYLKSTRLMRDGDLLLVDAAGNYQGLTGDITRTYPVNGRFSPAQRELYDLVLQALEAGTAAARPGGRPADIGVAVRRTFAEGLEKLGLVKRVDGSVPAEQVNLWFPHSPTHGIGVDVHDPLGQLDPGAAFVIEPGLYIRPVALDELPDTPEGRALAGELRPAVERYKDLGIRIEESFLMTAEGPRNLSVKVPRGRAEIERLVGSGR